MDMRRVPRPCEGAWDGSPRTNAALVLVRMKDDEGNLKVLIHKERDQGNLIRLEALLCSFLPFTCEVGKQQKKNQRQ